MKFHWKVLLWMLGGVLAGFGLQLFTDAPAWSGAGWEIEVGEGLALVSREGPAQKLPADLVVTELVTGRGGEAEQHHILGLPADFEQALEEVEIGTLVWVVNRSGDYHALTPILHPDSARARILAPIDFLARIFMALLKMLIVPLVMSSIMAGVASIGNLADLRRMGLKTFAYYLSTSLLAILVGQALVNLIRPGEGAALGLTALEPGQAPDESFWAVLERMVPSNIVDAMGNNGAMLSMIFFALLFGFFVTQTPEPQGSRMRDFIDALFAVMLRMAKGVLSLLPYGVFCLLARVVGQTGFAVFEPLLVYMGTVTAALVLHAVVTLPLVLRFVGGLSPRRWFQAMSPALMTAFSTSSSSMTLPVTLETVEKRGKVSNKVTSFTLPLGATINMDGTALYECIGVIFLAQYYASTGDFELTLGKQAIVVVMALLASIGAAGIPSAGLVMMLTILAALKLPLEGAALLLAVDRPLDMLRTVVNVWSDSCGAAVIARSEGEAGPLTAGAGGG